MHDAAALARLPYHNRLPLRWGIQDTRVGCRQLARTPQYAVVYVLRGEIDYHDQHGRQRHIRPGDALQRLPDCGHRLCWPAGGSHAFIALPTGAWQALRELGLPTLQDPVLPVGGDARFESAMRRLGRQDTGSTPWEQTAMLSRLLELVVGLHRRALHHSDPEAALVSRACALLEEELTTACALPEVAERLGVAYPRLRRHFQRLMACPPGTWRLRRRMERAQELLEAGSSVAAVAEAVGYSDAFTFSRQFRRHCGTSPSRWQQQFDG
ncbi:MAG: helix-turn-helix domain-containing protein [Planctomycetota bacterium]